MVEEMQVEEFEPLSMAKREGRPSGEKEWLRPRIEVELTVSFYLQGRKSY